MNILVTGSAGFIGFHMSKKLILNGHNVIGIDNLNNYYSTKLKKDRLKELKKFTKFSFSKIDINNYKKLNNIFVKNKISIVINLAAEVGVRNSIEYPHKHINTNIVGFSNILEISRKFNVKKLIFASSSSVYGDNKKIPYSVNDITDTPVSIYAATKKTNELMAYSYSSLFDLGVIGLRFFTVYGPWGRPDMAVFGFTESIYKNKTINLYNNGNNFRDYTYIDDIVEGILNSIKLKFTPNKIKYEIFNLGNKNSISTLQLLKYIENETSKKAKVNFSKKAPGDVLKTLADIKIEEKRIKYKPKTNLRQGIKTFIEWYKVYNKLT